MEQEIIQEEQEQELYIGPDTPVQTEEPDGSETAETTSVEAAVKEEQTETPVPDQVDESPEVKPDSEIARKLQSLTDEVEKANKRLGYEQRQREKLERQIRQSQASLPRTDDVNVPSQDDFNTYEEYQQAFIDYRIQQGIANHQRQQMQMTQQSSLDGFIDETATAGREMYSDFDDVVMQNHVPITQPMLQIMQNCEHPESIAYYLGKNIKEATAISRMSPIQATRAISHIENKVGSELAKNPTGRIANPGTNKKVSKAPPPVKPTGSSNVIEKDPAKMTMAEYEAWRAKGGGR
jgi:hypothetical protein